MTKTLSFHPNHEYVLYLNESDPQLGRLVNVVGELTITLQDNYYEALVKKIIGQQLSVKVAATIWNRVFSLFPECTPESVQSVSDEDLREAGVSKPKISYIRDLTIKMIKGELDLNSISSLSDQEIIDTLTSVKGIGKWTAEMFLIFSLGRLNVLSHADAGLQRAAKWLYRSNGDPIDFSTLSKKWSPYNTVASLYLWEIVNRQYIRLENLDKV